MTRTINDATLTQAGTIYQYIIALKDCFELNQDETLQIEVTGDISIINKTNGKFQKEIKHHFGDKELLDRDFDFWKTLANWYTEYEQLKSFAQFILSTTANISNSSPFFDWNTLQKDEKLKRITDIGSIKKKKEETFRNQYNRIFNTSYNKQILLSILDKFTIESSQTSLAGISNEFSKHIGHIPLENRDGYIGALLGEILFEVKNPPHKWEVTTTIFEKILQAQSAVYGTKDTAPLPKQYAKATIPKDKFEELAQKKFVVAIKEINYSEKIPDAVSDYWKTDMTVAEYFKDNIMYLESLDAYKEDLAIKLNYAKDESELSIQKTDFEQNILLSKRLYLGVMQWDANDFGSIVRNQGFFQRGVIHDIVDETEFKWKVGEKKHEH